MDERTIKQLTDFLEEKLNEKIHGTNGKIFIRSSSFGDTQIVVCFSFQGQQYALNQMISSQLKTNTLQFADILRMSFDRMVAEANDICGKVYQVGK